MDVDYEANTVLLDEAIKKYTAENLERQGVITGWVVLAATTRFDDEGDACYAYDYCVGPDTNPLLSVGLIETAGLKLKKDMVSDGDSEEGS